MSTELTGFLFFLPQQKYVEQDVERSIRKQVIAQDEAHVRTG